MTDIQKVITSLAPQQANSQSGYNTNRTYTKSPESDRPVMYNTCGFLETSNNVVYGAQFHITNTNIVDDAQRNSQFSQILSGSYLNNSKTLTPPIVGPDVSRLICINAAGANITWTWPSVTDLCTYLRGAFPGMYRPGLAWDTLITNHRDGGAFTLTLTFSPGAGGQTVLTYGQNSAINDTHVIPAADPNSPSVRIRTLVTSTVPGSERMEFFVFH